MALTVREMRPCCPQKVAICTVLGIKDKYGKNAVLRGLSFTEGATARERNMQVGGHRGGEAEAHTTTEESDANDSVDTEEGWTP